MNGRAMIPSIRGGRRAPGVRWVSALTGLGWLATGVALAAAAPPANLPAAPPLPDVGVSVLRVFGALAVVLALFLAGVWLFRHGRELTMRKGRPPRLNVLETRSLGNRYALYVVGYDEQRLLIAASPAGITLLTQLPPAAEAELVSTVAVPTMPVPFFQTLQQVLTRK